MEEDYSLYADDELTRAWNRLEKLASHPYVEKKMDLISAECGRRGIVAWNKKGEIISRGEINLDFLV